ncbi:MULTISPECIES: glycosyltransferase family 9 protein [unclassified Roseateles]|uniref:glycosyltransferase family 9 protein n=1 Tax=unclassified Roseateles TaxID=2626991 RepID=UPI0006F95F5E|nr:MULTISPECIES: glycosyltransferase family 9 protein [unclassified Roseateles]KQW43253.1 glycosyl transferase [Pelomonas sp. Root405]KRA70991.1 glycosyl transferase [Pelomonas sp. Root662]
MSEAREQAWRAARRVLLVRLDNLGDVLMTTPAIAAVRECLPAAHLALLAAPMAQALVPHLPGLDEIMGFNAPWVKAGAAALQGQPPGEAEGALLQALQQQHFDAAIIFTVCTQSALPAALLCRLAGIPLVLAHTRERAYGLLSDEVPDTEQIAAGMRHEVRRQLDLVAQVGLRTSDERLRFALREADRAEAHRLLLAAGVNPVRPYVLIHPGASAASRRYPAAGFGAAAALLQHAGVQVVFCAGPGEGGLLDEAATAMGGGGRQGCVLAPLQQLGTLAALVAGARVLVANNSGPVHLAAALGTPVVDLYALTNPQHTPWQVRARVLNHDVPCRNCLQSVCAQGHHDCLRQVAPRQVADATLALLEDKA